MIILSYNCIKVSDNYQLIRRTRADVQEVISSLNPKKLSDYDLITGKILKQLPTIGMKYIPQASNVALLKGNLPAQRDVA
jgi:hypothetical protein